MYQPALRGEVAELAEGAPLLREYTGKTGIAGSNPALSAKISREKPRFGPAVPNGVFCFCGGFAVRCRVIGIAWLALAGSRAVAKVGHAIFSHTAMTEVPNSFWGSGSRRPNKPSSLFKVSVLTSNPFSMTSFSDCFRERITFRTSSSG